MKSFVQFIREHVEFSPWMDGKEASKHITSAQFKTIGKHQDHQVYTSDHRAAPKFRVDKESPNWRVGHVRHIQVHHPVTGHTIEWHISRKGKYYAHTVYKHHAADKDHEHPYMSVVKHRQID